MGESDCRKEVDFECISFFIFYFGLYLPVSAVNLFIIFHLSTMNLTPHDIITGHLTLMFGLAERKYMKRNII